MGTRCVHARALAQRSQHQFIQQMEATYAPAMQMPPQPPLAATRQEPTGAPAHASEADGGLSANEGCTPRSRTRRRDRSSLPSSASSVPSPSWRSTKPSLCRRRYVAGARGYSRCLWLQCRWRLSTQPALLRTCVLRSASLWSLRGAARGCCCVCALLLHSEERTALLKQRPLVLRTFSSGHVRVASEQLCGALHTWLDEPRRSAQRRRQRCHGEDEDHLHGWSDLLPGLPWWGDRYRYW